MPNASKAKGDKYEREIAAHINALVFQGEPVASRAPLSGGGRTFQGAGESDLEGTPHLHVEAKRTERFQPWEAMRQAEASISARRSSDIPVVITRRNRTPTGQSLVCLRLDDFLKLYASHLSATGYPADRLGKAPPPSVSALPLFADFALPAGTNPSPRPAPEAEPTFSPLSAKA